MWTYRSYYKAISFKYLPMSYKSKDYPFKEQSLYTYREREVESNPADSLRGKACKNRRE
jgi:hypothetical protein